MVIKDIKALFRKELGNIYPAEEIDSIVSLILIDALGIPKLTILTKQQLALDAKQDETVMSLLEDLRKGRPIQHLLGKAHFYGMLLKVNPDVLIPRQETEELVDWIIKDTKGQQQLRILDVCTGSGCIALALKKHLRDFDITAIDLSEKALNVAKENADDLNLQVTFLKADALNLDRDMNDDYFDIIVSNPPYIPKADKDYVQKNVWMYEPHIALFVNDEKPLEFYECIGNYARKSKPVTLYFEINEDLGKEITELMKKIGFNDLTLKPDLKGKIRMIRCRN